MTIAFASKQRTSLRASLIESKGKNFKGKKTREDYSLHNTFTNRTICCHDRDARTTLCQ